MRKEYEQMSTLDTYKSVEEHPEIDKEIGVATSLKPVLLNDYGLQKVVIPLNPRKGLSAADVDFNENGKPLCPTDGTPFMPCGHANGVHRFTCLKFICPKSKLVRLPDEKLYFCCQCQSPCSPSKYGRYVYVPLNKNLLLCPGISCDDPAFARIYTRRTCVEHSINVLKDTLNIFNRKTSS